MIDPIVDEVRKNRESLYAEFGRDLRLFLNRIRELERQHPERLITKEQLEARCPETKAKSA